MPWGSIPRVVPGVCQQAQDWVLGGDAPRPQRVGETQGECGSWVSPAVLSLGSLQGGTGTMGLLGMRGHCIMARAVQPQCG